MATVKYCDLRPAITAYREGQNVTATLRKLLGEPNNTSQIIEIAYDLQAGSYIEQVKNHPGQWSAYTTQLSEILGAHVEAGDRLLEVGTGEMTTLTGVANCSDSGLDHYAMDISWSRIARGREFIARNMRDDVAKRLQYFVGDLFHLPLRDKSMDVVWTSHAIEPNGGREKKALAELFRVARKRVVLFEPSYENNSIEGRIRMEALGYIKDLPDAITAMGGSIRSVEPVSAIGNNPLNPTYAYVITPPRGGLAEQSDLEWACPATGLPMERKADCFWSDGSKLAYPIIGGIPVLRAEAAVLATALV
jgi:hypothetical protein